MRNCVVCGREDPPDCVERKSGLKCRTCIGISSRIGIQSKCVVCNREDRPGELRKSGFKCIDCIGTSVKAAVITRATCVVCGRYGVRGENRKSGFKCVTCRGLPAQPALRGRMPGVQLADSVLAALQAKSSSDIALSSFDHEGLTFFPSVVIGPRPDGQRSSLGYRVSITPTPDTWLRSAAPSIGGPCGGHYFFARVLEFSRTEVEVASVPHSSASIQGNSVSLTFMAQATDRVEPPPLPEVTLYFVAKGSAPNGGVTADPMHHHLNRTAVSIPTTPPSTIEPVEGTDCEVISVSRALPHGAGIVVFLTNRGPNTFMLRVSTAASRGVLATVHPRLVSLGIVQIHATDDGRPPSELSVRMDPGASMLPVVRLARPPDSQKAFSPAVDIECVQRISAPVKKEGASSERRPSVRRREEREAAEREQREREQRLEPPQAAPKSPKETLKEKRKKAAAARAARDEATEPQAPAVADTPPAPPSPAATSSPVPVPSPVAEPAAAAADGDDEEDWEYVDEEDEDAADEDEDETTASPASSPPAASPRSALAPKGDASERSGTLTGMSPTRRGVQFQQPSDSMVSPASRGQWPSDAPLPDELPPGATEDIAEEEGDRRKVDPEEYHGPRSLVGMASEATRHFDDEEMEMDLSEM